MRLEGTGNFSYTLEVTKNDCAEHGIDFDMIKEYLLYKENKSLYDKVPSYYFEPPTPPSPPKKENFFKRLFKKNIPASSKPEREPSEFQIELETYYQKKLEEIRAKGLKPYSKADLLVLNRNESKLISLVTKYANSESEKEDPPFENRGSFSFHYEITENDIIIFYVNTASYIL